MADEIINSYLDPAAIKSQTDFLLEQLKRAQEGFDTTKASRDALQKSTTLPSISAGIKDAETATRSLTTAQKELTAAKQADLKVQNELKEQLLQLKIRNAELTVQAKEKLAADKDALKVAREKSAADKQAASDAVTAGREKILQLRREQEELEKLEQAARDRNTAEQQALSGTFNPGGGKGNAGPKNEPLNLSVSQGNILLLKQYESEIAKVGAEINKAQTAFKNGEISQNAYKKVVIESTEKIRLLKANVADLNKEMKLQENVNNAERNSLQRAQALILQYTNEKKKLNLATEDGKRLNDNYGKAIDNANKFLLKNADVETQRTKNIGNYGSALNKILGPVRTLANILPGIGLSGIFLLAFEGIQKAIEALGLFNSKLFGLKEQQELLTTVNTAAAESAGKEAASLKILRTEIENTAVPMETRLQAVKDIKKEYPDYFKGLTNEQILTGQVGNAYDLAAASILRKARANAAAAEIEKLSTENLKTELKLQQDAAEANRKIATAKNDAVISSGGTAGTGGNLGGVSREAKQRALVEDFEDKKKAARDELRLNGEKINFLLKIATEGAKETIKIEKAKVDNVKATTKGTLDSDFEIYKINQQRKIKLLDEETNDQKLNFDKRIQLLNAFSTASIELIDRQEKEELRKNEAKEKALRLNLATAKGTERSNLLIEIQNNETARGVIEAKAASERIAVFDANEKRYTEIVDFETKRRLKIQKDAYDKTIKLIDDEAANKRAKADQDATSGAEGLQQRYEQGKLSLKQYNKQRAELEFAYGIESLQIEIDAIKKKIAVSALLPIEKGKALKDLAKLEKKLQQEVVDHTKKTEAEKLAAQMETFDKIRKKANDVFAVVDGLLGARETATKNKLKEQSDAAEKKAARDIELVNASTASEQDKAAKILIINARLAAQKEQIAQKEKKAEQDRAKFQKATNIFNIILNTAQAVVKQIATTPLPLGLPFIAAVAALGAAQLAVAIATPIPKYKYGKKKGEAYEGPAIVNDGAHMEAIQRADGSIEFPQGRNVLTHVGKNDIVHPDREAFANAVIAAAFRDSSPRSARASKEDPIGKKLDLQNKLLKEIADKPNLSLGSTDKGMVALWQWGSKQTIYTSENTNW